jgi:hypothetical protein
MELVFIPAKACITGGALKEEQCQKDSIELPGRSTVCLVSVCALENKEKQERKTLQEKPHGGE